MKKNRNPKMKLITLILILVITIGYAALRTGLNINGTANIPRASWDIHFENVQINENSVSIGEGDSAATVNQNDNTEVNYAVTFNQPGDFYEFNVDIKNSGTIDGMIESITSTLKINDAEPIIIADNKSNLPPYLDYSITYSDDIAIKVNHELAAGEKETLKVRLEFKRDITNEELEMAANKSIKTTIKPVMVQKNRDAFSRYEPTTYNLNYNGFSYPETESYPALLGKPIGELPVIGYMPSQYEIYGWYTKREGGEEIDEDTILKKKNDTFYLHWASIPQISTCSNCVYSTGREEKHPYSYYTPGEDDESMFLLTADEYVYNYTTLKNQDGEQLDHFMGYNYTFDDNKKKISKLNICFIENGNPYCIDARHMEDGRCNNIVNYVTTVYSGFNVTYNDTDYECGAEFASEHFILSYYGHGGIILKNLSEEALCYLDHATSHCVSR